MPPIPHENVKTVSEGPSSSVERSVAKAAGSVLGFIAGDIPGAIIGADMVDYLYQYKGQPVEMLKSLGEVIPVPVIPYSDDVGIGYYPKLSDVYSRVKELSGSFTDGDQRYMVDLSKSLLYPKRSGIGKYRVRKRKKLFNKKRYV